MRESFVCIAGAQRCGTTYLYNMFDAHPEILMAKPVRPEPKFFLSAENVKAGKQAYLDQFFSGADAAVKVLGEKGTSYIEFPEVAVRIKSYFAEANVILMLRNPVQRALSNYYFSVQNGLETRTAEEVFILDKPAPEVKQSVSVSPFNYLGRGDYQLYLEPFMKAFGARLRICIFEETIGNRTAIQSLYGVLGVDDQFVPPLLEEAVNTGPDHYPDQVSDEVKTKLFIHYREPVKQLEQMLNRTIPSWHDTI